MQRLHLWVVIALLPLWTLLSIVLGVYGWIDPTGGDQFTQRWAMTTVILLFAHPVAMYADVTYINSLDDSWTPEPAAYTGAAVLGIIVPVIAPVVATGYLYLRFSRVGLA